MITKLKKKIYNSWLLWYYMRKKRIIIFAINKKEICCVIMPGSEGSMEENNLAPFSMKILSTLIQPFYTCIDVIKLKQDDGITNLFEMVKDAITENAMIKTLFITRIPQIKSNNYKNKQMFKLDVNIELLRDAPIIYLQRSASSIKGVKKFIAHKSFTEILLKHHQGCCWLSSKSKVINMSITQRNVAFILENIFEADEINGKRIDKFINMQKCCESDPRRLFKIYTNLRIPRKLKLQEKNGNGNLSDSLKKSSITIMKKKIKEEMISLDHFITTVFNENTSMNVMFIDDTIEDLNQGYGQLVTKSAENTTTHSTS